MSSVDTVTANRVIDDLGGTAKTAEICEITPGAVSQWRLNGIPKAQLKYIQAARPELFSADANPAPNPVTTDKAAAGEGV